MEQTLIPVICHWFFGTEILNWSLHTNIERAPEFNVSLNVTLFVLFVALVNLFLSLLRFCCFFSAVNFNKKKLFRCRIVLLKPCSTAKYFLCTMGDKQKSKQEETRVQMYKFSMCCLRFFFNFLKWISIDIMSFTSSTRYKAFIFSVHLMALIFYGLNKKKTSYSTWSIRRSSLLVSSSIYKITSFRLLSRIQYNILLDVITSYFCFIFFLCNNDSLLTINTFHKIRFIKSWSKICIGRFIVMWLTILCDVVRKRNDVILEWLCFNSRQAFARSHKSAINDFIETKKKKPKCYFVVAMLRWAIIAVSIFKDRFILLWFFCVFIFLFGTGINWNTSLDIYWKWAASNRTLSQHCIINKIE